MGVDERSLIVLFRFTFHDVVFFSLGAFLVTDRFVDVTDRLVDVDAVGEPGGREKRKFSKFIQKTPTFM